jgi:outer membrane protein
MMIRYVSILLGVMIGGILPGATPALTLDECQKMAVQANSDVLLARLEAEKSGLTVKQSYSDLYPSVSGRLSTSYSHTDNTFITTENSGYTLSGTVSQNIFYPGMISGLKAAKFSEEVAGLNVQEALSVLESSIVNLYFSILASSEMIATYQENIRFAGENLKRIKSMVELGLRTESDRLKVEVQKGQFQTQLLQEEQKNSNLKRQLNILIGRDPAEELILQPIEPEPSALPDLQTARKHLVEHNFSLLALEKQMELQRINRKIKKETYLPTVSGNYSYSYRDDDAGTQKSNTVGLSANLTLFDGFRRKTETQKADIDIKRLEIQYKNTVDALYSRLEELYQTLKTYRKMEAIQEMNLKSAQRDYELITQQVEIGSGTILDQLDAQISVLTSESRLVEARYNTKITEARIKQLLGK